MLKYPCLVLDHDDTVVKSESTINYPFFVYMLDQFRPGTTITIEEYVHGCCHLGFADMCRKWYNFTEQELIDEYAAWQSYIKTHIPDPFPGIQNIIQKQKAHGGMIFVVSHSSDCNILRDYRTHFGIEPDGIYSWDLPEHLRKPSTYALDDIMQKYHFTKEQILVVDDMKPAYEMASHAGVDIAFAAWGRKDYPQITEEMSQLCTYSFSETEDLDAFLFGGLLHEN